MTEGDAGSPDGAPTGASHAADRWTRLAIAAVVGIAVGGVVPFLGREALTSTFQDDSFYYFQVARNVASGHGFTFDGLHRTNGFHPLWLLVLVPIYALVPGDVPPLRVIGLAETAFLVEAALVMHRTLRSRVGAIAAALAAVLVVAQPGAPKGLRGGTESALLLCILVVLWRRFLEVEGSPHPSRRQWLGLGGWCALAYMARLEGLMVVPAVLILGRRFFRADPWSAVCLAAPAVAWGAAYAAWNRAVFGTWISVSGLVKTGWARRWDSQGSPVQRAFETLDVPWAGDALVRRLYGVRSLYEGPHAPLVTYLVLMALVLGAAWRLRRTLAEAVRTAGLALPLLAGALILLLDKVTIVYLFAWHRVPIYWLTPLAAAALLARTPRLAKAALAAALGLALARAPLTASHWSDPTVSDSYYRIQAADWFRTHTPEGARIGSWNSGMLGYYSHRHVVGLDGLVGDLDFYERVIRRRELLPYLQEQNIAWLADFACGKGDLSPSAVLSRNPSHIMFDQERLDGEYEVETVLFNPRTPDGCPGWVIWKARRREAIP